MRSVGSFLLSNKKMLIKIRQFYKTREYYSREVIFFDIMWKSVIIKAAITINIFK